MPRRWSPFQRADCTQTPSVYGNVLQMTTGNFEHLCSQPGTWAERRVGALFPERVSPSSSDAGVQIANANARVPL